ncbi:MAG TPA: hypothetical protein VGF81_06475 [Solirubrobacteraceae bacterium]|jgi:hypothetical protein
MAGSYDQRVLPEAPEVKLGRLKEGGVAPAIMAIVDRGVRRRPHLAGGFDAEIELDMGSPYPAVRIVFQDGTVVVEDGKAQRPDLRITGELPDLVSLMVMPHVRGLPNPIDPRGRAALGLLASRRVKVEGKLGMLRRFLGVIQV